MQLRFFNLAKKLSKKSNHHMHKLGCVVVKKNRVISKGFNEIKTHPKSPHEYKTIHAEFSALLGMDPVFLRGATLYVYRELKNGKLANARPCKYCWKMLKRARVRTVYYTHSDGYIMEAI